LVMSLFASLQSATANTAVLFGPGNQFYPTGLTANAISGIQASSFNTLVLFSMSVQPNGDFIYGGAPICQNGAYVGPSNWGGLLNQCRANGSAVTRIEMCIGGWGDQSFANIKNLIASQGTGTNSVLYNNLRAMTGALGIQAIDYDDESTYDAGSAVSFGQIAWSLGMRVTLCPYTNPGYWQSVKAGLGGIVDTVYLQCYSGGGGNSPSGWNGYFGGLKVTPGYWDADRSSIFFTNMINWNQQVPGGCPGGFLWPSNTGGNPPCPDWEALQLASWIHASALVGHTIALQSRANGKYVCADNGGGSALIANRPTCSTWEQFNVINAGNGYVALQSLANNKYVSADYYGNNPLIANRPTYSTWEQYTLTFGGNPGFMAIQALVNNKYVCADNGGASPLIANRTAYGTWEQFNVTVVR
jgi:hypothetical protein